MVRKIEYDMEAAFFVYGYAVFLRIDINGTFEMLARL